MDSVLLFNVVASSTATSLLPTKTSVVPSLLLSASNPASSIVQFLSNSAWRAVALVYLVISTVSKTLLLMLSPIVALTSDQPANSKS